MNKRYLSFTMLASVFLLSIVYIVNAYHKKTVLRCSHALSIDIEKDSELVTFRTNTAYIYYSDNSGIKVDLGTMNIGKKNHTLNRSYQFTYNLDNKVVESVFTEVHKSYNDTAPEYESLLKSDRKIIYHITIERLNDDGAYLLKNQGFPIAVCS